MSTYFITKESESKTENDSFNSSFNSELSNSSIEVDLDEMKKDDFNNPLFKIAYEISEILKILIEKSAFNSNIKVKQSVTEIFNSLIIPQISIYDYLKRIIMYSNIEENTLISSLIYIDRLCIKNVNLNKYSIHKILFSCILLSIKTNEDNFYKNDYYSEISGIPLKQLNFIEYNLLVIFNFETYISSDIFNEYKRILLRDIV